MSRNTSLCFAALTVFVVATSLVVEKADAATFIVGDTMGWRVPSGADAYATWASRHTFGVGDTLVFNFPTGIHDVAPVTKEAFDACNSSAIISLLTIGPANVTLTTPGQEYFICTFGQHCVAGQKLAVNVTGSSISPSPHPTPTITPSPSTTPPSTTPPPSSTAAPPPVPETPPPSSTSPSSSMSPSGRPAIPPSSSMSPSGGPPIPPSSSISPSGGPAMPPSSSLSPSGGPGMPPSSSISPSGPALPPSPEDSAAPGSLPSDDGTIPPPPSGATRKDVATIFVTIFISTAVGYMF